MSEKTTARLDGWLARLRDRDDQAFGEMAAYFARRLESLASRMLKGFPDVAAREQTSDVVQESLLRLSGSLKGLLAERDSRLDSREFHGEDFFRLAAFHVRRELLDLARRYRIRRTDVLDEARMARPGESTWDPARMIEWAEFHEKAAGLPEEARRVFDLLYYDGFTQEEAAALLQVSVRTIKSRWQDARLRLKAQFGGRMPGT